MLLYIFCWCFFLIIFDLLHSSVQIHCTVCFFFHFFAAVMIVFFFSSNNNKNMRAATQAGNCDLNRLSRFGHVQIRRGRVCVCKWWVSRVERWCHLLEKYQFEKHGSFSRKGGRWKTVRQLTVELWWERSWNINTKWWNDRENSRWRLLCLNQREDWSDYSIIQQLLQLIQYIELSEDFTSGLINCIFKTMMIRLENPQ